ncbi:MAG: bifunctional molybdenum cofactor biosynthesis protein MoaC/MoaB [Oligoflexia bacterium]|nr:bifunctional molybdenum cofactor biosynthesis protein MoaC/MoaB [Oligoflexia bacterium]
MSEQKFKMIDVGEKPATRRRAIARGRITMGREAFVALRDRTNPKGDVLAQAEVAGILGAKRASDMIPLCHPLPLDQVLVRFELDEASLSAWAICEASATAKTGVEMEALAGVTSALLAVYDLSKAVDPALLVSDIHLSVKEGGKSGHWTHPLQAAAGVAGSGAKSAGAATRESLRGVPVAVLTISDRVSRGEASDGSGPLIEAFFRERGAQLVRQAVVADERAEIGAFLKECASAKVALVISTGGTGLSPRDVTPEAVLAVQDRAVPGLGELLRSKGLGFTSRAVLSRSVAAMVGGTLVVTLPGSSKAVREGLSILDQDNLIGHALEMARGGDHPRKE